MANLWFISDTHFGHKKFLTFKNEKGDFVRKFSSVEEMDETLIENWNKVIKPSDKVYHLGDCSFDYARLATIMPRLNGQKRLIAGNHDDLKNERLVRYFKKVGIWRLFKEHGFVCSHIPLLPSSFPGGVKVCVHGHIHDQPDPSPNHLNICVERTNYSPLSVDEIVANIKSRSL